MEALFLLPIAFSSADKSSSLSGGAGLVGVGDDTGGVGYFFLGVLAFGVTWVAPEAKSLWCLPMHGPKLQSKHQLFRTQAS